MTMTNEQWSQHVGGFRVINAAIGFDSTRYCFPLRQDTDDGDAPPQIRMRFARMERPQENLFFWEGLQQYRLAGSTCRNLVRLTLEKMSS